MKIIKNTNKFKVQRLMEAANPKHVLIDAFWETLYDIVNREDIDRIGTSYSYLSSAIDKNIKENPDTNFKEMIEDFDREGWDKDTLSHLFTQYGTELSETYNNDRGPASRVLTGMVDYFMYKMTDGKALLMGYSTPDIGPDEAFYKFYYGYNKTPYGKLAMIQHFGSLDKYYDYLGENIVKCINNKTASNFYSMSTIEEFMDAIEENYGITDLSQYYDYDKATKTGTLDLGAAGIHVNADLLPELTEFLSGIGLPLTGVNYDDNRIGAGGKSTMENNVIKLYFDQI